MKIYYFYYDLWHFCHFKLDFSSNIVLDDASRSRRTLLTHGNIGKASNPKQKKIRYFLPTSWNWWHFSTLFLCACRPTTLSNVHHRIRTSETIHQIATTVQWSLKLRPQESQKPRRRRRKRTRTSRKSKSSLADTCLDGNRWDKNEIWEDFLREVEKFLADTK